MGGQRVGREKIVGAWSPRSGNGCHVSRGQGRRSPDRRPTGRAPRCDTPRRAGAARRASPRRRPARPARNRRGCRCRSPRSRSGEVAAAAFWQALAWGSTAAIVAVFQRRSRASRPAFGSAAIVPSWPAGGTAICRAAIGETSCSTRQPSRAVSVSSSSPGRIRSAVDAAHSGYQGAGPIRTWTHGFDDLIEFHFFAGLPHKKLCPTLRFQRRRDSTIPGTNTTRAGWDSSRTSRGGGRMRSCARRSRSSSTCCIAAPAGVSRTRATAPAS